jgi:paraquat-inducible protein B
LAVQPTEEIEAKLAELQAKLQEAEANTAGGDADAGAAEMAASAAQPEETAASKQEQLAAQLAAARQEINGAEQPEDEVKAAMDALETVRKVMKENGHSDVRPHNTRAQCSPAGLLGLCWRLNTCH